MKGIGHYDEVRQFTRAVSGEIKWKEPRAAIRAELESHIGEIAGELIQEGMEQNDAVRQAVLRMGDPVEIGKRMQSVHKPTTDWGLPGLLALLLGIGIFAMFAVQGVIQDRMPGYDLVGRHLVSVVAGVGAALLLWRMNYRKISGYSNALFMTGIGTIIFVNLFGLELNGTKRYIEFLGFTVDMMSAALFFLLVSASGMKPAKEWGTVESIKQLALRLMLPEILFLMAHAHLVGFYYAVGFFIIVWLTRKSMLHFILQTVGVIIPVFIYFMHTSVFGRSDYIVQRLTGFIRMDDPQNSDYYTYVSIETIRNAGWWGQGYAASANMLPYIHTESLFTFMIYSFGWSLGLFISGAVFAFIIYVSRLVMKIREPFGKRLAASILGLLSIQFIWSVFMCIGWAPFVGVSLPFVSYGNTLIILHCAAAGLIFSVTRRRRLPLPTAA
ncbi:FtsW/RodA/SpoVE family cell cycle protein [Paenibacillus tarimensis]